MKKVLGFIKKYKLRLFLIFLAIILLMGGLVLFKILVKVGNIKYIYNYTVNTAGSLPALQNYDNKEGADKMTAKATQNTLPSNLNIKTRLQVDGVDVTSYTREEQIYFDMDYLKSFPNVEGIITFRGNYLRNLQSYGTTNVLQKKFDRDYWSFKTGKVLKSNGVDYWSGNGWTGQPLVVRWDDDTKQIMNLYEESKKKAGLTEVIYSGMDGMIHFLDLDTGEPTRDPINIGMTFKGSASLHPDGIPMIILGSGDAQPGMYGETMSPRVYIYSLIDGKKLYEFGANDPIAPRIWHAYDSSPIIDTKTDTLIYPGENGVLYTMKLNTNYDKKVGTLSVNPSEIVRFTYSAERNGEDSYKWGTECSATAWGNYLFAGDNGGVVYCLDLNTMELVWTQDVRQDVNSSPIFEEDEDGNKYLYVATTLAYELDNHSMGQAAIFKLNAMTGEIIWEKPYEVHTIKGLAGGILSTGILGKENISDYIIYSVSKTPSVESGYIVALNKESGEEVWRIDLDTYSWSSGDVVYTEDGNAYLIQGCQNGDLLLIDASNGQILDKMNFGTGIEATPVIFENRLVVGTRNEQIIGVTIR
ncbi:outer membrane protein assembly factor BamB family protein [Clostridium sp. Marseille-P299]|uniref:outer membrane protein assembly factor BamB family protein n=1 Tax=Clostridium sp. Marseille-P299 TaxID=1805477 RepID=UPI00082A9571|nr:PQQ-binding-like beta-propeller repeat protein [Clostridium sp. Marseille-P299]